MPVPENVEIDVDGGQEKDIFDINAAFGLDLFEGDIILDEMMGRNSIIGDQYRWPLTIPYYLEDTLEINAKGLILEAFERYRLKTCIDFKPWEGEANYISVFRGSGCYSSVGNRRVGKQQLSIGTNCDRLATIQHEFLHALGFWHEQSRSDRDDYVTIVWDRIQSGKEHNFNKYDDKVSSNLNVPYDYTSVMHYSKTAFQNGSLPTIVTRIPDFSEVIGQRMDFSDYDLEKLNRMYNCTSSLSFMDQCSFEYDNVCGMVQGARDKADWQRVLQVNTGPSTDHTIAGSCRGSGHFMHFSTATGSPGDNADLESRLLYPKRGFQCLEFFYYNSGHEGDQLNIWVKKYTTASPNGTYTLEATVKGETVDAWQLIHIPLKVTDKFRVVFQGVKGSGMSTGGFAIDDINLSETVCPHHVWHIRNFTHELNTRPAGDNGRIYSPRFYSKYGYAFQIGLYINGTDSSPFNLGIYFHLVSGDNDDSLQWPCPWKQATMTLLDQNPDIRSRMSNLRGVTTDPTEKHESGAFVWDRPNKTGSQVTFPNGTSYYRGPGKGTSAFITHDRLRSRDFIKGDDVFILLSLEDVSHLTVSQPAPTPTTSTTTSGANVTGTANISGTAHPPGTSCEGYTCQNDGVCVLENQKPVCRCKVGTDWWYAGERCEKKGSSNDTVVIAVSSTVAVFAVMLIITLVSVYCLKKKYKKKLMENNQGLSLQNKISY
ncbi:meprin A subunit beta isoform X2 [Ambystoma mexicanum]|uniref:meprin A subunit beta isoform X2 n=1 Tax=Ambystoma mexicanum TaxID=8296 RepID=UPI0037E86B7F